MGWQITFNGTKKDLAVEDFADPFTSRWEDGTVVDLDDLSPDVFDAIAQKETDASWWGIYRFPGASGSRLYAVMCAAAKHAGIDPPAKPSDMRESRALLEMIEQTKDIEDLPVQDGFPQKPSETETASLSGLSDDSDGDLPKLDENALATS